MIIFVPGSMRRVLLGVVADASEYLDPFGIALSAAPDPPVTLARRDDQRRVRPCTCSPSTSWALYAIFKVVVPFLAFHVITAVSFVMVVTCLPPPPVAATLEQPEIVAGAGVVLGCRRNELRAGHGRDRGGRVASGIAIKEPAANPSAIDRTGTRRRIGIPLGSRNVET